MPVAKGMVGWDSLTALQQSAMLAYDQVTEYTRSEWEVSLAGGKKKPSSAESKPSEAQRQGAAKKGARVS